MSDYEMKPGAINLFKNENRTKDEQPIITGEVCINISEVASGVDADGNVKLRIALWGKESKMGVKYWRGKVQLSRPKGEASHADLPPMENTPVGGVDLGPRGDQPWVGATAEGADKPENDLPF